MRTTWAFAVVPPAGTDDATHCRSTPKGEQLVPHWLLPRNPSPWTQWQFVVHFTAVVDFQTSACRGRLLAVSLARLHQYSDLPWSVATQSSPLLLSAGWIIAQEEPALVDR